MLASLLQAQINFPATTEAAMLVIQKDLRKNGNVPSPQIMNDFPVYKLKGQYYIAALCKVNPGFNKSQAIKNGLDVGAVIGGIASVRVPLHLFNSNFSFPGITYLEVADKIAPQLESAVVDTRADSVHMGYGLPQSYTGKNVLIGVVDWGFDYTHPTFYDTTLTQNRILAAWDQEKTSGPAPTGFSHGTVYTDTAALMAAESDTFSVVTDYHGTHVAGIAGGSGGGTIHRGIGFESNLLFSQMKQDLSSSLDAFQWMYDISQAEGKRLVINNSWSSYGLNPMDGTSLISQAIESFINLGVVFVFSGGNNGNVNLHLKKTYTGDSLKSRIGGFDYTDPYLWGQSISMWGEAGNSFSTQLRITNSSNVILVSTPLYFSLTAPAYTDSFLVTGSDTIWYKLTVEDAHPLNGRPQMLLQVRNLNPLLRCVLFGQAASGTVHYWNAEVHTVFSGNIGQPFISNASGQVNGDKNYATPHPGITDGVITVAAHVSNAGITSFSSYGPRMDDVLKPDVSAPGSSVTSAFSSFSAEAFTVITSVVFNGKTYEFVKLSGTSMSSPMVTGIVALLLEANPGLTPDQVKTIIINTAREDSFTGTIPPTGSTRWGWGKVNAYAAVQSSFTIGVEEIGKNDPDFIVYPNPNDGILFVKGKMNGNEQYILSGTDGKQVISGKLDPGGINLDNLSQGIYLLKIMNGEKVVVYRVVVGMK